MIEIISKREPKKNIPHSVIVLEFLFLKWFLVKGTKPQEKKKHT
jgi:hypothetical protein